MKTSWICYSKENNLSDYCIFLFPHSGAGASIFASWGKTFQNEGFSFYPVQYPMRESRSKEELPNTLIELVHNFVDAAADIFTSKKYILYGRCFGSLAAYEAARYAKEKFGTEPSLFLTASGVSPKDMKAEKMKSTASKEEWEQQFIKFHFIKESDLENETFVNFYLPVLKADYILQSEYDFLDGYKLKCPVCALYGEDDPNINEELLEKWKDYTYSDYLSYSFKGSHFFENKENIKKICEIIKDNI